MKVYLDDERNTPEGWVRTYTVQETIDLLRNNEVTHLSLDNDLGSLDSAEEGFRVLDWLEEQVFVYNKKVPEYIAVHSANAARAMYMNRVIERLKRIAQERSI